MPNQQRNRSRKATLSQVYNLEFSFGSRNNKALSYTEQMSHKSAEEQLMAHGARNFELRKTLQNYGVEMNSPRLCDLNFDCPDEAGARDLAADLQAFGIASKVKEPFEFGFKKIGWIVAGSKTISPNDLMDESLTGRLIRVAMKNRATYDGWGTAISEAAKPTPSN